MWGLIDTKWPTPYSRPRNPSDYRCLQGEAPDLYRLNTPFFYTEFIEVNPLFPLTDSVKNNCLDGFSLTESLKMSLYGPTGGKVRYDTIVSISFSDKRLWIPVSAYCHHVDPVAISHFCEPRQYFPLVGQQRGCCRLFFQQSASAKSSNGYVHDT